MRSPALCLALLASCDLGDMPQQWQLDRTRLLAIRADPAEPQPGDVVELQALSFAPGGDVGTLWYMCPDEEMFDPDCELDEDLAAELRALDADSLTEDELGELESAAEAAGVLGRDPGYPPALTIPEELLYVLEMPELAEGLSLPIHVQAWDLDDPQGDVEHALKYLPVSLAETPNANPEISALGVAGLQYDAQKPLLVQADEACALRPVPRYDAVETYTYVNNQGAAEEREEELEYRWYTDAGELEEVYTGGFMGDEESGTQWTAPSRGRGHLVLVAADGRGGMGWMELLFTVE